MIFSYTSFSRFLLLYYSGSLLEFLEIPSSHYIPYHLLWTWTDIWSQQLTSTTVLLYNTINLYLPHETIILDSLP